MASKYTKRYSEEFKRDAVALVAPSGRTVTEAARELGISSESLRGWVKKAYGTGQTGAGTSVAAGSGPDTAEREELKRLRKLAAAGRPGQSRP
ncbi:transposase [Streptomyces sp. bgisy027]|uniref:transposase n=1 Tax=Streptomyces sp. bgisy027 TaxID=3413770 RepID=UPI003D720786